MFLSVVYLHGIIVKGERNLNFLVEDNPRETKSNIKRKVYYLYGIKRDSTKFIENGELIIEFANGVDLQQFAKKHGLKLLKKIGYNSYLFKIVDNMDTIQKNNKLFELKDVIYISPNWHRQRKLL
jgi:hypothetical protein